MLRAYWRNEITLRYLRVLIDGLPHDSPVHRYRTDGETWTWTEKLLWYSIFMQEWAAVRVARAMGDRKAKLKRDKPLQYPWSEDKTVVRYGDRGDLSNEEAKAILDNL